MFQYSETCPWFDAVADSLFFSPKPFLRSSVTQQIVTYDDPESLGMKGAFVKEAGLLGVNMWDAHGDTREWDLIDSIRRGLDLS